ncbi:MULTISPECIES: hypothetical protein [unclassified Micromonospora]|uniref:hypothetical protein n=1 Tax=unclassified Micromonospora TaxID=2617518 RepID=UPI00112C1627|nr:MULTISPECIES: hypothetical protein [unclassified Micromonospora]MCK1809867.1 hypothetical protein [Micromonospora sp. R42106]MCK1834599.1 hypothetical protein [Micromonospora sp. R42003]MCK1847038.1 hypothetical protein [Micromonospora sp. R42004]MCM1017864.1 hypothetical protein [Micromonospora sp. XM-20-01]
MAFRTWGRLLLTALGVSVLAGAGQLGIAYGFGVVRLDGAFVDASVNRWPAQLVWVGWFAVVATVAGAVLTERFARRDDLPGGTTELLSIAGVSALGATVVAPLCMQPARAAELAGSVDPVWAAGVCAALGAVVGAGAAIAVLLKPPFGWGVAITAGIVWLLALLSVAPTIVSDRPLASVRLGVLEPSWLDPAAAQRLSMLLLPTLALLAGGAVGVLARRAGWPPLVGGAAGAAGPVLVAFAYLTAGPGAATDRYQIAPYYGALIAVVAGALGSTATTMLPRPVTADGDPDAIEATELLAPLPHSAAPGVPAAPPAPPVTSGAAAPAHWNWPEPGGSATATAPAGTDLPAAGRPALADLPAADLPTAAERPAGERPAVADTSHGQPMPGLLPPGRRTSAIDVLAAGRPDPVAGQVTGTGPGTGTGTGPGTAHADSTGEAATTDRPATPDPAAGSEAADRASGQATGIPADSETATATGTGTGTGTGTDDAAPAPEAAATTPRVTRPRRTRAGRSSGTTDGPVSSADGTAPRPGDVTTPSAGAGTTAKDASPATADSHVPGPRTDSGALAGPVTADAGSDTPAAPPAEAPGDTGAAGRAARPRRTRTPKAPRATGPASPGPADTAPTTPGGRTEAAPSGGADAEPIPQATNPDRDDTSTDSNVVAPTGRTGRNFFFDDPSPAPSTRPRFAMFEDVTGQPGEVRPAWPITPAGRPHRATAEPDAPDRDAADAVAPGEPAPRPRHRGLPEPGASTGWDALATNARPAGPLARPEAGIPLARPEAATAVPGEAGAALPEATETEADSRRGRHAGPDDADAPAGKPKARRGLFRRNRAKGDPEPAERTAEPGDAADDEYVDWVAGLASDDNADDARSLRTGRHHRD